MTPLCMMSGGSLEKVHIVQAVGWSILWIDSIVPGVHNEQRTVGVGAGSARASNCIWNIFSR